MYHYPQFRRGFRSVTKFVKDRRKQLPNFQISLLTNNKNRISIKNSLPLILQHYSASTALRTSCFVIENLFAWEVNEILGNLPIIPYLQQ